MEYIPILKLSLPTNTVSRTGTNIPLPRLIGKGSFGKVYSISEETVYKEFKIIATSTSDFALIENNIKEFSFYKLLMTKSNSFTSSVFIPIIPTCVSIPISIRFKNPFMYIEMSNYGVPLSSKEYTTIDEFKYIFKQLIEGIESLNKSNMSHGDLKPNNILIDKDNNITIIDYGSICFFHSKYLKNKFQRCTIFYVSPEELLTGNYSLYNDWWSLGVIMFEFYTRKCFIKSLLQTLKLKDTDIELFLEYSFSLKVTEDFNPKSFLIDAFSIITENEIRTLLKENINNTEILYILELLLVFDPQKRGKNKKEILNIFNYIDNYPNSIEIESSLQEFSKYNFKHMSISTRRAIIDHVFKICTHYSEFGKELIGHSIMLFDRYNFRIKSTGKNPFICIILCIILSSLILRGESFKGNIIRRYILECYGIRYSLSDLQEYILEIIETLDYSLLCLAPDMLYNFEIDYSKLHKLALKYPLINKYIYNIYKMLRS